MAVTLADIAKQSEIPLKKGVLMALLRHAPVLEMLPFEDVSQLNNIAVRWSSLPSVGFRKINAGYSESSGTTEQVEESVKGFGGDVDLDTVFDHITNVIEDPRVTQTNMKLKALAYSFNYHFIQGGPAVDPDGFYGLYHRIDSLAARQKFAIGSAGTPHDVTASTANQHKFMDGIVKLFHLVGGADAFFCNFNTRLGFASVLRRLNLLDTSKDMFDREVFAYNGAPIIDIGVRGDQSTEIILDTEDPGDGGTDTTSIVAVNFGAADEGLVGMELTGKPFDAYWVGGEDHELEAKPVRRLRVDWWCGLAGMGKYHSARMYNLAAQTAWT